MEVTQGVTLVNADRRRGRIEIGEGDPSLVRFGGLAVSGELARRLRLVEVIDAELAAERRAAPVKLRRRGVSPGELVVALAEGQLVGGECFSDIEQLRQDTAGAGLRAAGTPSAPAALQRAKRFRRVHCQRIERAMSRCGEHLDRALGGDPGEAMTVDLDATQIEVYGAKDGAARNRHGQQSYAPHIAFWAQRGRALTSELVGGNRERLTGAEYARIARRAIARLPEDHGPLTFRIDSAYYTTELLDALRSERAHFTVSVPRSQAMWTRLAQIPETAWEQAIEMDGAQVAETTYQPGGWKHEQLRLIVRRTIFSARQIARLNGSRRLHTIHPEQLQLALEGQIDSVYGYSFILADIPAEQKTTSEVEHFHRHRAQIEERLKESKLGQALRRLPSADINANRVWLTAALLAVNLTALCCQLCPAAGASGKAPAGAPLRRAAKTLRNLIFCLPARIIRTGRRLILRPPAGYPHAHTLRATLHAIYTLGP